MTVQGLGASLSPALGGWLAQYLGYPTMFMILGSFALLSIALWVRFSAVLKPACASKQAEPPVGLAGARA
jgi:MFS family permease